MTEQQTKPLSLLWSLLCCVVLMAIAVLAWLFNMGWVRFVLLWTTLPIGHIVLLFLANLLTRKYLLYSKPLSLVLLLFNLSYLLTAVLLPDKSDYGPWYAVFRLIQQDAVFVPLFALAGLCFLANIALFVMLMIKRALVKRRVSATMAN